MTNDAKGAICKKYHIHRRVHSHHRCFELLPNGCLGPAHKAVGLWPDGHGERSRRLCGSLCRYGNWCRHHPATGCQPEELIDPLLVKCLGGVCFIWLVAFLCACSGALLQRAATGPTAGVGESSFFDCCIWSTIPSTEGKRAGVWPIGQNRDCGGWLWSFDSCLAGLGWSRGVRTCGRCLSQYRSQDSDSSFHWI